LPIPGSPSRRSARAPSETPARTASILASSGRLPMTICVTPAPSSIAGDPPEHDYSPGRPGYKGNGGTTSTWAPPRQPGRRADPGHLGTNGCGVTREVQRASEPRAGGIDARAMPMAAGTAPSHWRTRPAGGVPGGG
jgi:hypothetical protein